jgi:mRNA-degrading endonuclease RelE of RelBE toxin-antitoxin system
MRFIETHVFTRELLELLSDDDDYRALQIGLLLRPDAGDLIRGTGGLRKLRFPLPGRGKRGGVRVIYYLDKPRDRIFMLLIYKKSRQEDLTPAQRKILRKVVEENLR